MPTLFSYDGQAQEVSGWPETMPSSSADLVKGRDAQWAEIGLCSNTTLLGYGQVLWQGKEVKGFYFQSNPGSAAQVSERVGLGVFQLGDVLFFAPEEPPPAHLRRQTRAQILARLFLKQAPGD